MKKPLIFLASFVVALLVMAGFTLHVSAQQNAIPSWIKNVAKWWADGKTSDSDFLMAIQYLIDQNILQAVPSQSNMNKNSLNLQGTNESLSLKLSDLQSKYDSLQSKYNLLLQQVKSITAQSVSSENNASISAVAVRPVIESNGFFETTTYQGAVLTIAVEIRDGTGLVLANTAIPSGVDFQTAARTAVMVAQKITGIDLSAKDVIFSISAGNDKDLQAVDGGSAGGAMTVLLVSDLLGKTINNHVLMTGTIQSDGTIGPIGAVSEKADAAGQFGAKIFLVPKGQGVIPVQTCSQTTQGPIIYQTCKTEQKPLSPMMESKYGMQVIEISTIQDALKYFNSN